MLQYLHLSNCFVKEQSPHNHHVTETLLTSISSINELKQKAATQNVFLEDDHMVLQGKNHTGSLITFNDPIDVNHFSISFTIDHLQLRGMEKSGIFIWATEKKISTGKFKGGPGKFKGLMAGIEFSHNTASLVFTYNNNMDFSAIENYALHMDPISREKIDGVEKLTIKIIHTSKNFKIEVYDGDYLLSDTFKVNDPLLLEMDKSQNHFAITTFYNDPSKDIAIDLASIEIFRREESEDYTNMDLHTEYNADKMSDSEKEVTDAVANLSHFMAYMNAAFGGLGESTLHNMTINVKEEINKLKQKADELFKNISDISEKRDETYEMEGNEKLDELDATLGKLYDTILEMKNKFNYVDGNATSSHMKLVRFVVCFGIFIAVATILRLVFSKKDDSKKTLRNLE